MKVLVAGAGAFVGRQLVRALAPQHAVYVLTRQPSVHEQGLATAIPADLTRADVDLPLPDRYDAVVYGDSPDGGHEFPADAVDMFRVNIDSVLRLLEHAVRSGARRFVLLSTGEVYQRSDARLGEQSAVAPETFYARTKRAAEMLIEPYGVYLNIVILRLFTVYGPDQPADGIVASMMRTIRNGGRVAIEGENGGPLTPIFVTDVVDAVRALLERNPKNGVELFNVGGSETVDVASLAAQVSAAVGRPVEIARAAAGLRAGWAADSSALTRATGWTPRVMLTDGLRRTAASLGGS